MSRVVLAALCAAVLLAALGCGLQKGETWAKYRKGGDLVQISAPSQGIYALYTTSGLTPEVRKPLEKGQPLGFRKAADGSVQAFAGDLTVNLKSGTQEAYWKREGK